MLRFWNAEVFDNIDGVFDTIYAALYGSPSAEPVLTPPRTAAPSDPPPQGEGGAARAVELNRDPAPP